MMDNVFAVLQILCVVAFGMAFDAWQKEREKRKSAEFDRDFFHRDARQCAKLLREGNELLCDLANCAGELGRLLAAWDAAAGVWKLTGAKTNDEAALERANAVLARFGEYAERNNLEKSRVAGRGPCHGGRVAGSPTPPREGER